MRLAMDPFSQARQGIRMTGSVASHVPPSASPASASPNARGYYPWRAIHSSLASSTCSRPIVPVRYIPPRPPPTPRPHVESHPAVATLFIPVRDENRIEGNGSRKHSVEERTNSPDKRSCWTGCPREQAAHDPYYSDEKATPDRIGFRHVFCQSNCSGADLECEGLTCEDGFEGVEA